MKMSDALAERYGANWRMIDEYVREVPEGFLFRELGKPHVKDGEARRLYTWDDFRKTVDYLSDANASPENCGYLRFLCTCDKLCASFESLASGNGLDTAMSNATGDAVDMYVDKGKSKSRAYLDFVYSVPDRAHPYNYWRNSIMDHCSYISAELVVAHLTRSHLFRDMWYWYRAGHWPCGWEGEWPEGRLIVF